MPTKKNIATPEKLWRHYLDYKKDQKNDPKFQTEWDYKKGEVIKIPKEVPLTFVGFRVWLRDNDITSDLNHYEANTDGRYSAYSTIVRAIKDDMYKDKFNGASAGIFKENIIARELGLADKQDQNIAGEIKIIYIEPDIT